MAFDARSKGRIPNLSYLNTRALMVIGELAIRAHLKRVTGRLAQRHSGDRTSRDALKRVTGQGIDRLKQFDVKAGEEEITGTIHLKGYMALHEFGGTITPKRKKYLTVPLPAALNSDGTPKKFGARARARTRIIKSKRGNLLIVMQQGRQFIPLYVLKEQVKIAARLGLRKELKKDRPALFRDVRRAVSNLLRM